MFGSEHSVFRAEIKYYRLACGAVKLMIIIYAFIKSTEKTLMLPFALRKSDLVFNRKQSLYALKTYTVRRIRVFQCRHLSDPSAKAYVRRLCFSSRVGVVFTIRASFAQYLRPNQTSDALGHNFRSRDTF